MRMIGKMKKKRKWQKKKREREKRKQERNHCLWLVINTKV